jgi:hypothetical protein
MPGVFVAGHEPCAAAGQEGDGMSDEVVSIPTDQWVRRGDYMMNQTQAAEIDTQAAEFTRELLEQVRQLEEEISVIREGVETCESDDGDERKYGPPIRRILARLESALADLRKGMKA